jgi:WD40 repeat protein
MSTPSPPSRPSTDSLRSKLPGVLPNIPDYELLRRIGGGSYGEVWLARSVLGAYRAVKVIYRQSFDDDRPYEREFRGIKSFEPISREHDSQVDILHVGRNDFAGHFYYVMELADDRNTGQQILPDSYAPKTLKSELDLRVRLPFQECIGLGVKLATALEHIHGHGLVHRDIKPSNIIFVNGSPKLADIGLVTAQDATISFVGTMGYLAPEGPGAPPADVYSLGKVIYEASTGKERSHFPDPATKLEANADVNAQAELNEIVLKACAHNVRDRYQSAQELKSDLLFLQSGKSVKRLRNLERKLALLTRAGLAASIIALIALGAYFYQHRHAEQLTRLGRESQERLVRLNVSHGVQRMEAGDYLSSLVWFTEALKLEQGDRNRESIHRFRIEAVWRDCPKLVGFGIHPGPILHAEFSRDGRRFVVSGSDGTARVWDTSTGEPLSPPLQHGKLVRLAAFSPDGSKVATVGEDLMAKIWEAASGELACPPLAHGSNVVCVAFSPDGTRVLTASFDKTARLWDTATGQPLTPPMPHEAKVDWGAFSPNGHWVVTSGRDQVARVWDAQTGRALTPPLRHKGDVNQAVFSADGRRIVTASDDGTSRVWDSATGAPLTPPLHQRGVVNCAAFSPDGKRIVSAGGLSGVAGEARVWDADTGELIALMTRHGRPIRSASFSPDGHWIVTAGGDQDCRVWDASTGDLARPLLKHNQNITDAHFAPDGRKILTVSRDQTWRIWDLFGAGSLAGIAAFPDAMWHAEFDPSGQRVLVVEGWGKVFVLNASSMESQQRSTYILEAQYATFGPDGRSFVTATASQGARVWDTTTLQPVTPVLPHRELVRQARFSGDGKLIVTASYDETARIWDARTGKPKTPPLPHDFRVYDAAFSPDSRRIATAAGYDEVSGAGEVRIWDVSTGRLLAKPLKQSAAATQVSFSPDGKRLLIGCRDNFENPCSAQLWDIQTGRSTGIVLPHKDGVTAARFSPDGALIVTASEDTTARVWKSTTGAPIGKAMKHRQTVRDAVFSSDGQRVVTASNDGTARVWDALTGEPISPPLVCQAWVSGAAFSPDGLRVLAYSGKKYEEGEVRIWNLPQSDYSIEDLTLVTQLLSGGEIEGKGGSVFVSPEELLAKWRLLKARHPADFTASSESHQ